MRAFFFDRLQVLIFLLMVVSLVALFVLPARAQTYTKPVTVTWVNPTQMTDGSAIPAGGLDSVTVERWALPSSCVFPATGTPADTKTVQNVPMPTQVVFDAPAGNSCYRARAKLIPALGGAVSDWSNAAAKVVDAPKPKAPTLLEALIAWVRGLLERFA